MVVLPRGAPPSWFFTLLGNRPHSTFELYLPPERGMGMSMLLAVPVLSGSPVGRACPCRYFDWKHHRCHCCCRVHVCMLNGWHSCYDVVCADNYCYSRFMLEGKCRSQKLEVYLYGDMAIRVMVQACRKLRSLRSCRSWRDGMR